MKYGITLNMIVDDILNDKGGGFTQEDYSREQIMFKIFRWRELLIRRDAERNGINHIFQQKLPCLELELIPKDQCAGIPSGIKILQSAKVLPQLLRIKKGFGFIVTSADDESVYPAMKHTELRSVFNSRMTGFMKRSYITPDNYLRIVNDKVASG